MLEQYNHNHIKPTEGPSSILRLGLICSFLCLFGMTAQSFAQQKLQSNKENRAAQIRARMETLTKKLEAIESQSQESLSVQSTELSPTDTEYSDSFVEMSLEDLMNVEIPSSASLTQTTRRLVPSTMTTITQEQIWGSGARSLYEVLEMYVPNLQMMFTNEHPKALGLRGIISHRSDKFLLLVNGRVMNERTDFGVQTEVDLPMLTDIHHIDVVRGPSSALYGPGALSMTISIVTDNATTFEGEEITIRGGAIEEFGTFEYKRGKKLGDDKGYFFYAGVTDYDGAAGQDSPTVLSSSADFWLMSPNWAWNTYSGSDEVTHFAKNLNQMPYGLPKMKMYFQYTDDGLDLWGRYTQGGQWIDFLDWGDEDSQRKWSKEGLTYTQMTLQLSYKQEISSDLSIDYVASYDKLTNEAENHDNARLWKNFMEDEFYGKILATWTPHENHSMAFGGEWSRERFGERYDGTAVSFQPFKWHYPDSWGWMPAWSTDRQAVLGEYQWNINDQFTLFLSGRIDRHPYTDMMYSPRGVLIYTPTKEDTFKLMASRSARTNSASQMWIDYNYHGVVSKTENLDAFELRYERQHNKNLSFGSSVFYHDHDALAHSPEGNTGTVMVGNVKSCGLELEAGYHTDKFRLDASYSYTKLIDMELTPDITFNDISAQPFGYGDDFAQWYNQTAKIRGEYDLSDKLTVNGALYVCWDNPGGKDWAEWVESEHGPGRYDSSYDEPFSLNAYLNLGAEYKWSKDTTIQITGYNILGLLDEKLNKRRIGFDRYLPGRYRVQPVAFGATLTHKF